MNQQTHEIPTLPGFLAVLGFGAIEWYINGYTCGRYFNHNAYAARTQRRTNTGQSAENRVPSVSANVINKEGDWLCRKCSTKNKGVDVYCHSCGEYK